MTRRFVSETANAVFGCEQRDEFDARRLIKHVDRLASFAIAPGVVRDEAQALALQ